MNNNISSGSMTDKMLIYYSRIRLIIPSILLLIFAIFIILYGIKKLQLKVLFIGFCILCVVIGFNYLIFTNNTFAVGLGMLSILR